MLDLQEFVSLMRKIGESMKAAFAQVDSNQDGRISVCEMKQVNCVQTHSKMWPIKDFGLQVMMEECAKRGFTLTEENFDDIFKRMDKNADGELDYVEFVSTLFAC